MTNPTQGLICPNCASIVPIAEGARVVQCPACGLRSLIQGERGIRRWQVGRRTERPQAEQAVRGFWSGINKATGLRREAHIRDLFLVYLPYWRVQAFVVGWLFGRVKKGKDETRPVEVEIFEEMHWNDAAVDVAEYGVHAVRLSKDQLEPYDHDLLHSEAMVFQPVESATEANQEAEGYFVERGRSRQTLKQKFFEKFHLLRQRFSIVYYPLWVGRYEFRKRHYQVVVDGVSGKVLYGKAPGNIFYRAAALVAGMALGNLVLVNSCAILFYFGEFLGDGEDSPGAILLAIAAAGLGLMFWGYNSFRYGEEVEQIDSSAEKMASGGGVKGVFNAQIGKGKQKNWMQTGLAFLEELGEGK